MDEPGGGGPGPDIPSFMARHGLSQAEFGRLFGLTQQAVSAAVRRGRQPRGPTRLLMELADTMPAVMRRLRRRRG